MVMSLVYVSPTPVHSPCAAAMILHETLLDVMPIRCMPVRRFICWLDMKLRMERPTLDQWPSANKSAYRVPRIKETRASPVAVLRHSVSHETGEESPWLPGDA